MAITIQTLNIARDDFEAFRDEHWDNLPDQYSAYCQMLNDRQKDFRAKEVSSVGLPAATAEGAPYHSDSRRALYEKTWEYVKYTHTLELTDEAQYTDQFGTFSKNEMEVVKAFKQNRNLQYANLFNRAWDSGYTGPDGLVLAHTAHTTNGGTTFANEPATHAALDPYEFMDGRTSIRTTRDSRGRRMYLTPTVCLIVPPELEYTAREIIQAEKMPYTGDNTPVTYNSNVEVHVMDEITVTDFWGIIPKETMENPFFMVDRMPFSVEADREVRNGVGILAAHEEYLVGWHLPYRTWLVSVTEG